MVSNQPPNYEKIWDLYIVDTGPVGIALAMECERLGRDFLVLESGRGEIDPKSLWCKQVISGTASDVFQFVVR